MRNVELGIHIGLGSHAELTPILHLSYAGQRVVASDLRDRAGELSGLSTHRRAIGWTSEACSTASASIAPSLAASPGHWDGNNLLVTALSKVRRSYDMKSITGCALCAPDLLTARPQAHTMSKHV